MVAGLRGNAGAGGAMLALAADHVFAREGVVLNPHYKGMGGLYGSEYWTYTLPRRVGPARAIALTEGCRPMGAREAKASRVYRRLFRRQRRRHSSTSVARARKRTRSRADFWRLLREKHERRLSDERVEPLAALSRRGTAAHGTSISLGRDPAYHLSSTAVIDTMEATMKDIQARSLTTCSVVKGGDSISLGLVDGAGQPVELKVSASDACAIAMTLPLC